MKKDLERIKNLSIEEQRNLSYEEIKKIIEPLTSDEIIELSNIIGYPVFTRLCMGELKHRFVLLQDGAAAIIVNKEGQILLQSRADRDKWGLPGGCQELGERFQDTIIREIKEETNLDVLEKDLILLDIVSGSSRRNDYPNGDVVINNTALYCIRDYSGELKFNSESKNMKFFDIDNLPENQNDPDLIEIYLQGINKENKDDELVGNSRVMLDFLGNKYYYECAGCDIANKKMIPPGGFIYEDESFILACDPDVPIEGFLVITAKNHIKSITELSSEKQQDLMNIVNKSINLLKELEITKEVTILQEERSRHFHMWLFPNQEWMVKKFGKGASYIRDICEYAKESATEEDIEKILQTNKKLTEAFNKNHTN